jgi:nucleotide-binding universal stress UspA family protein
MVSLKRILVATDYSAGSLAALRQALVFAGAFGASVDIVHVSSAPYFGPEYSDLPVGDGKESLFTLIRERATEEMERFLSQVEIPKTVELTSHIHSGEPLRGLLDVIDKTHPDLAVIGTHGRTGPRYLVLGSVAARLVQLSPCPVLTVPMAGAHGEGDRA